MADFVVFDPVEPKASESNVVIFDPPAAPDTTGEDFGQGTPGGVTPTPADVGGFAGADPTQYETPPGGGGSIFTDLLSGDTVMRSALQAAVPLATPSFLDVALLRSPEAAARDPWFRSKAYVERERFIDEAVRIFTGRGELSPEGGYRPTMELKKSPMPGYLYDIQSGKYVPWTKETGSIIEQRAIQYYHQQRFKDMAAGDRALMIFATTVGSFVRALALPGMKAPGIEAKAWQTGAAAGLGDLAGILVGLVANVARKVPAAIGVPGMLERGIVPALSRPTLPGETLRWVGPAKAIGESAGNVIRGTFARWAIHAGRNLPEGVLSTSGQKRLYKIGELLGRIGTVAVEFAAFEGIHELRRAQELNKYGLGTGSPQETLAAVGHGLKSGSLMGLAGFFHVAKYPALSLLTRFVANNVALGNYGFPDWHDPAAVTNWVITAGMAGAAARHFHNAEQFKTLRKASEVDINVLNNQLISSGIGPQLRLGMSDAPGRVGPEGGGAAPFSQTLMLIRNARGGEVGAILDGLQTGLNLTRQEGGTSLTSWDLLKATTKPYQDRMGTEIDSAELYNKLVLTQQLLQRVQEMGYTAYSPTRALVPTIGEKRARAPRDKRITELELELRREEMSIKAFVAERLPHVSATIDLFKAVAGGVAPEKLVTDLIGQPLDVRQAFINMRQYDKWIEGSKVRDKNGDLIQVYHGSPYAGMKSKDPNFFTDFDPGRMRPGLYGKAIYTTESFVVAGGRLELAGLNRAWGILDKQIDQLNKRIHTLDSARVGIEVRVPKSPGRNRALAAIEAELDRLDERIKKKRAAQMKAEDLIGDSRNFGYATGHSLGVTGHVRPGYLNIRQPYDMDMGPLTPTHIEGLNKGLKKLAGETQELNWTQLDDSMHYDAAVKLKNHLWELATRDNQQTRLLILRDVDVTKRSHWPHLTRVARLLDMDMKAITDVTGIDLVRPRLTRKGSAGEPSIAVKDATVEALLGGREKAKGYANGEELLRALDYEILIDGKSLVPDSRPGGRGSLNNVRPLLEPSGFDGITHEGGKVSGGKSHRVWMAFWPEQLIPSFIYKGVKARLAEYAGLPLGPMGNASDARLTIMREAINKQFLQGEYKDVVGRIVGEFYEKLTPEQRTQVLALVVEGERLRSLDGLKATYRDIIESDNGFLYSKQKDIDFIRKTFEVGEGDAKQKVTGFMLTPESAKEMEALNTVVSRTIIANQTNVGALFQSRHGQALVNVLLDGLGYRYLHTVHVDGRDVTLNHSKVKKITDAYAAAIDYVGSAEAFKDYNTNFRRANAAARHHLKELGVRPLYTGESSVIKTGQYVYRRALSSIENVVRRMGGAWGEPYVRMRHEEGTWTREFQAEGIPLLKGVRELSAWQGKHVLRSMDSLYSELRAARKEFGEVTGLKRQLAEGKIPEAEYNKRVDSYLDGILDDMRERSVGFFKTNAVGWNTQKVKVGESVMREWFKFADRAWEEASKYVPEHKRARYIWGYRPTILQKHLKGSGKYEEGTVEYLGDEPVGSKTKSQRFEMERRPIDIPEVDQVFDLEFLISKYVTREPQYIAIHKFYGADFLDWVTRVNPADLYRLGDNKLVRSGPAVSDKKQREYLEKGGVKPYRTEPTELLQRGVLYTKEGIKQSPLAVIMQGIRDSGGEVSLVAEHLRMSYGRPTKMDHFFYKLRAVQAWSKLWLATVNQLGQPLNAMLYTNLSTIGKAFGNMLRDPEVGERAGVALYTAYNQSVVDLYSFLQRRGPVKEGSKWWMDSISKFGNVAWRWPVKPFIFTDALAKRFAYHIGGAMLEADLAKFAKTGRLNEELTARMRFFAGDKWANSREVGDTLYGMNGFSKGDMQKWIAKEEIPPQLQKFLDLRHLWGMAVSRETQFFDSGSKLPLWWGIPWVGALVQFKSFAFMQQRMWQRAHQLYEYDRPAFIKQALGTAAIMALVGEGIWDTRLIAAGKWDELDKRGLDSPLKRVVTNIMSCGGFGLGVDISMQMMNNPTFMTASSSVVGPSLTDLFKVSAGVFKTVQDPTWSNAAFMLKVAPGYSMWNKWFRGLLGG
uniref:Uncharacterized protein n=1 Tax=viral metagenome TaxID=1070528 RepID=A0A6H1ZL26_9ZZZZ